MPGQSQDHARRLEHGDGFHACGQCQRLNRRAREHGHQHGFPRRRGARIQQAQPHFGLHRTIADFRDHARQLVFCRDPPLAGAAHQHHGRRLDERDGLHTRRQPQHARALLGDGGSDSLPAGQAQRHHIVDGARRDRFDRAEQRIARARAQHEAAQQVDVFTGGLRGRIQALDKAAVLGFQHAKALDQPLRTRRQHAAATALAARGAHHQRLAGQVVHGVDGVPRGLVGKAHGFGACRDGAGLPDGSQQFDPATPAPVVFTGA